MTGFFFLQQQCEWNATQFGVEKPVWPYFNASWHGEHSKKPDDFVKVCYFVIVFVNETNISPHILGDVTYGIFTYRKRFSMTWL